MTGNTMTGNDVREFGSVVEMPDHYVIPEEVMQVLKFNYNMHKEKHFPLWLGRPEFKTRFTWYVVVPSQYVVEQKE